ncbi:hypothetical protein EYF80_062802 [Liparis tanakae]|uniref:Uncharacterized protein n=1 Tax=Liparis tanakae TaxID=230148 RepID=A0A4Z2EDV1_9TELE|nr:hypothetical protein EYF80_062802 [Liparis tanakae]
MRALSRARRRHSEEINSRREVWVQVIGSLLTTTPSHLLLLLLTLPSILLVVQLGAVAVVVVQLGASIRLWELWNAPRRHLGMPNCWSATGPCPSVMTRSGFWAHGAAVSRADPEDPAERSWIWVELQYRVPAEAYHSACSCFVITGTWNVSETEMC